MSLPKSETMLAYASILERPQYVIKNGVRFPITTGEVIEAACAALRFCAEQHVSEWIAYADKLEGVLELVCGESKDRLKQMHAEQGLQIVRPTAA